MADALREEEYSGHRRRRPEGEYGLFDEEDEIASEEGGAERLAEGEEEDSLSETHERLRRQLESLERRERQIAEVAADILGGAEEGSYADWEDAEEDFLSAAGAVEEARDDGWSESDRGLQLSSDDELLYSGSGALDGPLPARRPYSSSLSRCLEAETRHAKPTKTEIKLRQEVERLRAKIARRDVRLARCRTFIRQCLDYIEELEDIKRSSAARKSPASSTTPPARTSVSRIKKVDNHAQEARRVMEDASLIESHFRDVADKVASRKVSRPQRPPFLAGGSSARTLNRKAPVGQHYVANSRDRRLVALIQEKEQLLSKYKALLRTGNTSPNTLRDLLRRMRNVSEEITAVTGEDNSV